MQGTCSGENAHLPLLCLSLIPGLGIACGLSLFVLVPAPRIFLQVLWFSSLLKTQHSKFQFDPEVSVIGLSALLIIVTLTK